MAKQDYHPDFVRGFRFVLDTLRSVYGDRVRVMEYAEYEPDILVRGDQVDLRIAVAAHESTFLVMLSATLVTDADMTLELLQYLLMESVKNFHGHFALSESRNILFEYSIKGDALSSETLLEIVFDVLTEADSQSETVIGRFGGVRPREDQSA